MSVRSDLEAAMAPPEHKVSKQKAGYSGGMKRAHCAICRHFRPPEGCEVVTGRINPQAWCKYFEKKEKP